MVVIRCPEPPAPARRRHRVRRWPQPPAWRAAPAGRRGSRGTTQLGAARPGLELPRAGEMACRQGWGCKEVSCAREFGARRSSTSENVPSSAASARPYCASAERVASAQAASSCARVHRRRAWPKSACGRVEGLRPGRGLKRERLCRAWIAPGCVTTSDADSSSEASRQRSQPTCAALPSPSAGGATSEHAARRAGRPSEAT